MRTRRKLILLGSLYLSQGVPYGFFTQALPTLLRAQELSLPLIGAAQLLTIPWALKFLWAPWLDRLAPGRLGKRRRVILPLQLASSAILAALALVSGPAALVPLSIAILLVNLCSATQDIATDALAVELLDPDERGLGNSLQVGAYRVGMIVGGGFILWLFARTDWTAALLALAGSLVLATLPIALFREPVTTPATPPRRASIGAALRRFGPWLAVLATYKTGEWFATGMLRAFYTDALVQHRGPAPPGGGPDARDPYVLDQLATMLGYVGFSCALAGAVIGGLVARAGRRRALLVLGALQALGLGLMAYGARGLPSIEMLYAISAVEHVTSAMATAALFTTMMDLCRPDEAGTDYTIQASCVVIATGLASLGSGFSAEALGYAGHFLVAAGVSTIGVIVVAWYRPSDPTLTLP